MSDQNNNSNYCCTDCGDTFSDIKAWEEHCKSHEPHSTTQNASTVTDSSTAPVKRGRGRPRKNIAPQQPVQSTDEPAPIKRGRGRPPKATSHQSVQSTDEPAPAQSTDELALNKRGVGRPKKNAYIQSTTGSATPVQSTDGSVAPEQSTDGLAPIKRKPGRPPKSASSQIVQSTAGSAASLQIADGSAPIKRKPGRPPKSAPYQIVKGPDGEEQLVKRGRGRPRKATTHQQDVLHQPAQGSSKFKLYSRLSGSTTNLLDDDFVQPSPRRKRGRPAIKKPPSDDDSSSSIIHLTSVGPKRDRPPTKKRPIDDDSSRRSAFPENDTIYQLLFDDSEEDQLQSDTNNSEEDGDNSTHFGTESSGFGATSYGSVNQSASSVLQSDSTTDTMSSLRSVSFGDSASVNIYPNSNTYDNDNESNLTSDQSTTFQLGDRPRPRVIDSPTTTFSDTTDRNNYDTTSMVSGNDDEFNFTSDQSTTFQLGDHPRPRIIDSPTTTFRDTINPNNDATTSIVVSDNDLVSEEDEQNETESQKHRTWIERAVERDLAQRPKPPTVIKFKEITEQEIQQNGIMGYRHIDLDIIEHNARQKEKRQAMVRKREKFAKSIQESGGLVWKKPVVNTKPIRRVRRANKRSPTSSKLFEKLKTALFHSFLTALQKQGITVPTDEHKAMLEDLYHSFEQHLPLIDGTGPGFDMMVDCMEKPEKAKQKLYNLKEETKDALYDTVKSMMALPPTELNTMGANDGWIDDMPDHAVNDSLQQKADVFLAQFRAKHLITDTQAKTVAEIDQYALQLKKYPTRRIIPYTL